MSLNALEASFGWISDGISNCSAGEGEWHQPHVAQRTFIEIACSAHAVDVLIEWRAAINDDSETAYSTCCLYHDAAW